MSHVWDYDVVASPKYSKETKDVDFDDYWVIKKWSDYGMAGWRPKEIKITLLCNGEAYDQVTLTKDMDWRYSWKNMRTDCEWLVVEDEVSGYTTKIRRNGVIFTVTNTTTNPPPPQLPHTGQLWWPVYALMASGLIMILAGVIRRRGAQDE